MQAARGVGSGGGSDSGSGSDSGWKEKRDLILLRIESNRRES